MTRLPRSAKRLIEQVAEVRPDATSDASDLDGLGVYRTLTFDRATGKWLKPFVEGDDRIVQATLGRKGGLVLQFVSGPAADFAQDFPLPDLVDDALEQAVVDADEEDSAESGVVEPEHS